MFVKHSKYEKDMFFNKIYDEMYKEIYRYIRRFTNDNRILEDILQETFYESYKKIDILIDHDNYRGWIYKTAKFKALKFCQHIQTIDGKQVDILLAETQEVGKQDEYESITYADLQEILSDKEYNFLIKHLIEGYTLKELAKQENIKVGASKMRFNRIMKKLKKSSSSIHFK